MSIIIGDNFNYQGKQANFIRDSFETLAAMKAYPENSLDNGHRSFCKETKKYYEYLESNSINATTGRWRLITDTSLNESSENPVQNKVITAKINKVIADATASALQFSTQLENLKKELSESIVESEDIISAAFGTLYDRIETLEKILGQSLSDIRSSMVTNNTTINGFKLEGDVSLTKASVGLGNVDNTSDANKPISTATQTALNGKVDKKANYSLVPDSYIEKLGSLPDSTAIDLTLAEVRTETSNHVGNTNNPHEVTIDQLDVEDIVKNKGIETALGGKVPNTLTINGHALDKNFSISKGDLGINNVNNTSDLDKPISTATQEALNLKADDAVLVAHKNDKTNPHNVTAEQLGLEDIVKNAKVSEELGKKVDKETGKGLIETSKITDYDSHVSSTSNPHNVTASQLGLGSLEDIVKNGKVSEELGKKVSKESGKGLIETSKVTAYDAHVISTSNPHGVKKEQVGLGNVDNTSDADKPLSNIAREVIEENELITAESFGKVVEDIREIEQTIGAVVNDINRSVFNTWVGTEDEYDAIEIKDSRTIYYIYA